MLHSAEDLALRVPSLNKKELTLLASVGALNKLEGIGHRRDALWQVERAGKMEGHSSDRTATYCVTRHKASLFIK